MLNPFISRWENKGVSALTIVNPSEKHDKLIVLLHGYQGDADSNLEFGKTLLQADPAAVVAVFDGLEEIPDRHDPHVRQWWNLPPFEGRHYAALPVYVPRSDRPALDQIVVEANRAAERLNMAILAMLEEKKLKDVVLVGISQGGITAFEMALFRPELEDILKGLVVIGAGIAGSDRLRSETIKPVPVLLVRGSRDEIFPPTVDYFSKSILRESGLPVTLKVEDSAHFGLEHIAAPDVGSFISQLN